MNSRKGSEGLTASMDNHDAVAEPVGRIVDRQRTRGRSPR
jgi:hypothetical protein